MTLETDEIQPLERKTTGVEGFEVISMGGLVQGRATLLVGSSGSGKTLFSAQVTRHFAGALGEAAVFVTFEERPSDILRNVDTLSWRFADLVESGRLTIIDASIDQAMMQETGAYDLSGVIAQIVHAVRQSGATLVVLDSLGSLFMQYSDIGMIRREIVRIRNTLGDLGVTAIFTAERTEEYGAISRYGIEEFVSDSVIVLRHVLEKERIRRTIQVYKLRGGRHHSNEFSFVIDDSGIVVLPLTSMDLQQTSTEERVRFGSEELDEMAGGGLFQDSVMLVSGPTGSGKTLMCTTFAAESCRNGEPTVYFGFEESRPQLIRNAGSWGMDFEKWERDGLLTICCRYPDSQSLAKHLLDIRRTLDEIRPRRVVVDSVSAMERVASVRGFREFVIGLTSLLKEKKICSIYTSTTPQLSGGDSVTDAHISTITDAIILLRYVEDSGRLRRGALIIKMRGSQHEKDFREFSVDGNGLRIGDPLKDVPGILFGGGRGD